MLSFNDEKICLESSLYYDHYNFSFYKVNVTDVMGLSHSTSGEYRPSMCLNYPIPDLCRPINVTVEFIGFNNHIVAQEVVYADDCNNTETCLCNCIQERGICSWVVLLLEQNLSNFCVFMKVWPF